jgi:DNA repair protein RecO (recombination protein O)
MSYHLYQTEGIVLASRPLGEADKLLSILTQDFGRLDIIARGVRYLKSKLRYSLNVFAYSRIAFVSTKESWRLVDAQELEGLASIRLNPQKLKTAADIANLLLRFLAGPEPDPLLWLEFKGSIGFLEREFLTEAQLESFRLAVFSRILYRLGYISESEDLCFLSDQSFVWNKLFLDKAQALQPSMKQAIDKALEESQL